MEPTKADLDAMDKVRAAAIQMMEHFDTVQIFVCKQMDDKDNTMTFSFGQGNWYARYGQVAEWVKIEEEEMRLKAHPQED